MRRLARVLLTAAAVATIPVATTAMADAAQPETTTAGGAHLDVRLGGLQATVQAGNCCVAESVTGRLLGVHQNLSIGC